MDKHKKRIGSTTLNEHHSYSANIQCHNLFTSTSPAINIAKLLGLGRKFCLQSRNLNYKDLKATIERSKHDIRVKCLVKRVLGEQRDNITPSLCIKNKQS